MDKAALTSPLSEDTRLAELRLSGLLDSPPEQAFDRITQLAQRLLGVDVALVSLVDENRQFFKSNAGLKGEWARTRQSPLTHSFCRYAVATGDRFVIENARESHLMRENPAVEEQGVIAYAGQPLETESGNVLGTLCVIANEPRDWTSEELGLLDELTAMVVTEIEYRLRTRTLLEVDGLAMGLREPIGELASAVRSAANAMKRTDDPLLARMIETAQQRVAPVEEAVAGLLTSLSSARLGVGSTEIVADLAERVDRAEQIAVASARSGDLSTDIQERPLKVTCDPHEAERALAHVLITGLHHARGEEPVRVSLTRRDERARLEVFSQGAPMPTSELARIVSKLRAAMCGDPVGDDGVASVAARGGTTTVVDGPVRGETSAAGTRVLADIDLVET